MGFVGLRFVASAVAILLLAERVLPVRRQAVLRVGLLQDLAFLYLNVEVMAVIIRLSIRALESLGLSLGTSVIGLARHWPFFIQIPVYLLLFDFLHWIVHNLMHRVDRLWAIHRIHHRVQRLDWAASFHQHPLEPVVYRSLLALPALLIGFSPQVTALGFAIELVWGQFTHANLALNLGWLEWVVNSPRMHRWHHAYPDDTRGRGVNFGILFSCWDHLFGTALVPSYPPLRLGFDGVESFPDSIVDQILAPITWSPSPRSTEP